MNVGFLGLGKLGLPCALAVENAGPSVFGYDIDNNVKTILETRKLPYREEGAEQLLENHNINWASIEEMVQKSDIIFVPMVGFDKNLNRLGYGKGYYDKIISKLRKSKKIFVIGLAYDNQMVRNIPTENHDEKMDIIVTDKKIYK